MFNKRAIRGNAEAKVRIFGWRLAAACCAAAPSCFAPWLLGSQALQTCQPVPATAAPCPSQIWQRLGYFKNLKAEARKARRPPPVVGVLGCMAERLKQRLLESDRLVDLVAGPDAYRWAIWFRVGQVWCRLRKQLQPCHCSTDGSCAAGSCCIDTGCCSLRRNGSQQIHYVSLLPCRDLPRLIDIVQGGSSMGTAADDGLSSSSSSSNSSSSSGSEGYGLPRRGGRAAAMNVQLSADETCEC